MCFILLSCGFSVPAFANSQSLLREKAHKSWAQSEPQADWLASHLMVSWAEYEISQTPPALSQDPHALRMRLETLTTQRLLRVDQWAPSLLLWIQTWWDRPFDSLEQIQILKTKILTPLLWALGFVAFFWLLMWAPALRLQMSWLFARPAWLVVFLISMFALSIMTQQIVGIFLLVTLSCIYSRRLSFWLSVWILLAIGILVQPWIPSLLISAEKVVAIEALEKGRTRIEYSARSIGELNPLEQALWAEANGDRVSARQNIQMAPPSLEREIFEASLDAVEQGPLKGLERFEAILEKNPTNSTALFNASMMALQSQNLVKADRYRDQIPPTEREQLAAWSRLRGGATVWALPRKSSDVFWSLEKSAPRGSWIFSWTIVFVFLGLIILGRFRARGVCDFTGEVTDSVQAETTALYESFRLKGAAGLTPAQRQSIDQNTRDNQLQLERWYSWTSWFIPGASAFVRRRSPWLALIGLGIIFLTGTWAFQSVYGLQRNWLVVSVLVLILSIILNKRESEV
jgi:hypothetical protein